MDFKEILENVAGGKEVGQKRLAEAAQNALAKVESTETTNQRLRERAKDAGAQLGEEAATAGIFGTLELARGYRGEKGLKVWGKDPTMAVGLVVQGVGLGGRIMGKKWGRWTNAVGRGFTLSGFGAIMRNAGQTMAESREKKEKDGDAAAPPAPRTEGRSPHRALPHPMPEQEVIVSPKSRRLQPIGRLQPATR